MNRLAFSVSALLLTSMTAGCATLTSESIGASAEIGSCDTSSGETCVRKPGEQPKPIQNGQEGTSQADQSAKLSGLAYFLPRQFARVTATRTSIMLDDAVKGLLSAQSALEEANAAVPAIEAVIRKTQDLIADPKATEEGKKIQQSRLKDLESELADAKKAVGKKETALEAAKAKVNAAAVAIKARTELKIAAANAADAVKATQDKIDKTNADIAAAKALAAKNGVTPDTTALLKILSEQTEQLGKDQTAFAEKTKNLAQAPDGTAASANGVDTYKVALKVELLSPSADPAQAFRLSPRHTIFRDDEHKLTISSGGLLTSTDITATDRTGEVLVELATFAGAVKGLGGTIVGRDGIKKPEPCAFETGEYTGVVDFTSSASLGSLNKDIRCLGVRLTSEGRYWPATSRPPSYQGKNFYNAIEGIVYRTPIEVQVRIEKCADASEACAKDTNWRTAEVMTLSLPQAGPISFLRQDAGLLTKVKYDVAFKDGIPVDYAGSRPSELLAGARLPVQAINGFFSGVSKVISLRTGVNNDKAAFATSQLALLNSQIALQAGGITGQKTLTDAELAVLQSQTALQVGALDGKTRLSAAELALLQQQLAAQVAPIQAQGTLAAAQLAALQQQYALQVGGLTGETSLTNADLARLQAQTTLFSTQNAAATQRSALELALRLALLRDQAKHEALNRCIAEKMQASLTVDSCLADL